MLRIVGFIGTSREVSEASETAHSEALDDEHEPFAIEMTTNDLFIKDAFLVFRALCKLTMKPLNAER